MARSTRLVTLRVTDIITLTSNGYKNQKNLFQKKNFQIFLIVRATAWLGLWALKWDQESLESACIRQYTDMRTDWQTDMARSTQDRHS